MIRSLAMLACLAPMAVAETRISNGLVAVESGSSSIVLKDAASGRAFAPQVAFPSPITSTDKRSENHTIWGTGETLRLTHENGWRTDISAFEGSPFVQITTHVINTSQSTYEANSVNSVNLTVDWGISAEKLHAIGTGGVAAVEKAAGTYSFCAIADPETRHGVVCGWLTHERGVGAFFPKVVDNKVMVRSQIDFGHFQVDAGKSRITETLLIGLFDDARHGLEEWATSIARHYRIKLAPKPGVYCTWYHAGASNENALTVNTRFAADHLRTFGLSVMQIDDGWQTPFPQDYQPGVEPASIKITGPIKVFTDGNRNYPAGMAHMAKVISEQGMTPGIWFMPFAGEFRNPWFDSEIFARNPDGTPFHDALWSGTCIDLSSPKGEAFVRNVARRIYGWGYRYFKIDGMHTGIPSYNIYVNSSYNNGEFGKARLHDPSMTHAEAYRHGLSVLREEAPKAFILGCNVSQNMLSMGPAFGMIDAMRIGPDNGAAGNGRWDEVTLGARHGTNLYFLNNRIWHNDPDPVYVRPKNPLESARWMCSWMAVSGAMHSSSEQYDKLPPERLDLLKRCLPSHSLHARPVDYLESSQPRIWLVSNPRIHVVGLFNWSDKEATSIQYRLQRMGLDASHRYVAFDYWRNEFLPSFQDELSQILEPGTCRVLSLKPVANHPQLISTSRHITQGLIDVDEERWDADKRILHGTSQMVASDEYELRIVLPTANDWKIRSAMAGNQPLQQRDVPSDSPGTLRLYVVPQTSGIVRWQVQF